MPNKPKSHMFRRQEQPRKTSSERGYDYEWQQFRADHAERVPAVCVDCGLALASKLMHLDHIVPLSQGGKRLDPSNVQWRCGRCHSKKTAKEDGGFGGQGG